MSRRGVKLHWLVSGLIGVAIAMYFTAYEGQRSGPELRSVSTVDTGVTFSASKHDVKGVGRSHYNIPLRTGDLPEERHTRHSEARTAEGDVSPDSSVAVLPPADNTRFLDPNADDPWVNPDDVNRTPVNVGPYLDANSESPPSSTSGASDIEHTSIGPEQYISADTESRELVIAIDGDSGKTQSKVGHYLDPDAEAPRAPSVDQADQRQFDPFLEPDI